MLASISRKHVAIALVSASVLLLQIGVTRLLSVLLWYHWAFFAISLSMLGMGAPGVWLALSSRRPSLDRALAAAGFFVPLGVAAMVRGHHLFGAHAIVYCLVCLLPALLALGTSVCLLLLEADDGDVARMYGSDLLGACVGALAVVPLLARTATPELAACAGFLPLVAHELVAPEARRWLGRVGAIAIGASVALGAPYRIDSTKDYREVGARQPMFVRWTPTARLAVFPTIPWSQESFAWGMGARAGDVPAPEQYWLEQDASAGTPITRYDGDPSKVRHLFYDVTSTVYQLKKPGSVAIVGAGGGRDILTAHLAGATHVDAIELNPGIVSAMRDRFSAFSGGVYDLPGVTPIVGEGRSVLTRSKGGYDVIQISMIDSWAATAAGAYSLSENNLYTVEAYRLYYQRLAPDGIVSTSRWLSVGYGFEVQRLLLLVKTALVAEGVDRPLDHIAVVEAGKVASVLMSRRPFTAAEVTRLREVSAERGFTVALPTPEAGPAPRNLTTLLERGVGAFEQQGFALAPPTDDRPFFFQMLSPFRLPETPLVEQLGVNAHSVRTLRTLMLVMGALTCLLFFAPFALRRRLVRGPDFWTGSGYFLAIGLAFMLLEVAWLQRSVLYLGHPSLAATAVLGFVLLGAGLGSMASSRLELAHAERWGFGLAAGTAVVNLALGPLVDATLGLSLPVRLALTGIAFMPAGAVMGCAFPLGMRAFGAEQRPWFWAINGAASVLASVVSLALAMELGYLNVGHLGAALYVPAWLLLRNRRRGRPLSTALVAVAATPLGILSAAKFAQVVEVMAARIRYPIDLEWMEGGQILTAQRLLEGKPIYEACADGFIPFAYPPVHPTLVALAGKLFGLEYPVARGVSVLGFACFTILLCREVHRVAGRGARGAFAALAALGWLGASYATSGSWYDLVRVDATCMAFLVAGVVLALPPHGAPDRARTSAARNLAAAAALTAAVFSKQSALLFLPWLLGFAIWREWRSGLRLSAFVGLLAGGALLILNRASHGAFWILVFDVMGEHPLLPDLFRSGLLTLAFFAPYAVLLPPLWGWLWLRRRVPPRVTFWVGLALNAVVVSLVTTSKVGAYINNIMTAVLFVPPATIMVGAACLDTLPRRSPARTALAMLGVGAFGYLLSAQHFHRDEAVPAAREWRSAAALVHYVRDLPGTVLFPAHPYIPARLGKAGRQAHEQGYVDVIGAGIQSLDPTTCAANLDGRWLIVNDKTDPRFLELLTVAYEYRRDLPGESRMLVGKYTRPNRLYERRAGDRWQAARRDRRALFDFEAGALDGWARRGKAFEPGVTGAFLEYQQPIGGHLGRFLVNSFHPALADEATGTATSPPFLLDRSRLGFRAGGGAAKGLAVELVVDGATVMKLEGPGTGVVEELTPVAWDVSSWRGKEARLLLRDAETGEWGHLLADAFELFEPGGS